MRFVRAVIHGLLIVAAGFLAWRAVSGPFRIAQLSVSSPTNAAALVAVSFLLLTLGRKQAAAVFHAGAGSGFQLSLIAAAATIPFLPNLRTPFVFDDYTHLSQASHATWRILTEAFQPEPGGLFFRPVTFISYWLGYQWAHLEPARWHLWSMAVHAVNSGLVYVLLRRLGRAATASLCGALLFALHGTRAETVSWTDARSDLLAAFFVLAALLCVQAYAHSGRRLLYVPLAACAVLAVCTKEAAFCLPLLPLTLLPFAQGRERRRVLMSAALLALICGAMFAYRWWALGGIGGYVDATGARMILQSRPLKTLEALLFRQWAFLFFPINWSVPLAWWMSASAVAFAVVLILCARQGGAPRRLLLAGLAFVMAAALPVHHLLLLQPDLAGARLLYLPVVGLAIFWSVAIESYGHSQRGVAPAVVLVLFNLAALAHNLRPWRAVPAESQAVCRAAGRALAADPRPMFVAGLPYKKNGVYFLSNGFPECVAMNWGADVSRVQVVSGAAAPGGGRLFVWNPEKGELEEQR